MFFINFFSIYKNTKKSLKKMHVKSTKIFLQEKKKHHQYHCERNKNLSEEEKEKEVEYMRNYYLAHKK